jgi:hypothetical protein
MTVEEKTEFDKLTDTSYLFRLIFARAGFDLACIHLNGVNCWHLYYKTAIVGAITTRLWESEEDSCTYTNMRLYKYFTDKFPKTRDFLMSEFFEMSGQKRVRFDFDKFKDYTDQITKCAESLVKHDEDEDEPDTLEDSIARLKDFCDEFDDKFSNNTLFKDVRALLRENKRLNELIKEKEHDEKRTDPEERGTCSGAEEDQPRSQDSPVGEHSDERRSEVCPDPVPGTTQEDRP